MISFVCNYFLWVFVVLVVQVEQEVNLLCYVNGYELMFVQFVEYKCQFKQVQFVECKVDIKCCMFFEYGVWVEGVLQVDSGM